MSDGLPPGWEDPQIRGASFEPDGAIVIEYCIPAFDTRANGVVLNHILRVPFGDEYDEGIDDVTVAIRALIKDVLEDLPDMEPVRPRGREDDDDDDE